MTAEVRDAGAVTTRARRDDGDPARLDDRRPRRRPARPHVRDGGAPAGLPRPHARRPSTTRRPGRSPTSRSTRRTTTSTPSAPSPAPWTSSPSSSRTCPPRRPRPPRSTRRRAARRPCAAHRAAPHAREDVSRRRAACRSRRSRRCAAPDELARGARRARLPGGAEDGGVRLRRQGAGARSRSAGDGRAALGRRSARQEAVLEAFIDLEREISVIGARGVDGDVRRTSGRSRTRTAITSSTCRWRRPPCRPRWRRRRSTSRARVLEALDFVGVLCVEFFVTRDGRLLINELAPRPHNSGHLTFDACRTSQFEQQLRAVCGLPLGSPELLQPAAMANLLGRSLGRRRTRLGSALCRCPTSSCTSTARRRGRAARWATSPPSPQRSMAPETWSSKRALR